MHSDAFIAQAHEPFHRCADVVRTARGGVDFRAHPGTHHAASCVHKISEYVGAVVRILFQNAEISGGCHARAFARGNRRVERNRVAVHQPRPLERERDDQMRRVRRETRISGIVNHGGRLPADQLRRLAHWLARKRPGLQQAVKKERRENDRERGAARMSKLCFHAARSFVAAAAPVFNTSIWAHCGILCRLSIW